MSTKTITDVIKVTPIGKDSTQKNYSENWSHETGTMVAGIFVRFADLFGELARLSGLEIKDDKGNYTRTYKLWCAKLKGISIQHVATGMAELERRIAQSTKDGKRVYIPSYAEFIGMCTPRTYNNYSGLPPPRLSNDEKRRRLNAMREKLGL